MQTVFIGADHWGFELKNQLIEHLHEQNIRVEDMGNMIQDPEDDYTTYAKAVAQAVLQNPAEFKGIVICGSGIGVSMMANRFKGIRAGLCQSPEAAKHGRANDDINVLALASSYITTEDAEQIVDAFLTTSFIEKEKYIRRSRELDEQLPHGPSDTSIASIDSP